nr:cupin domain-containing protein [uncultured Pseudodesulfovibrio sp.]
MNTLFTALNSGRIVGLDSDIDVSTLEWNQHPTFAGVALKHLLTGKDTDSRFSIHLVRLGPGAKIGDHIHDNCWELHEVADGSGVCLLNDQSIEYTPGVAAVMPEGVPHSVQAGESGLCLLAKFIPALME